MRRGAGRSVAADGSQDVRGTTAHLDKGPPRPAPLYPRRACRTRPGKRLRRCTTARGFTPWTRPRETSALPLDTHRPGERPPDPAPGLRPVDPTRGDFRSPSGHPSTGGTPPGTRAIGPSPLDPGPVFRHRLRPGAISSPGPPTGRRRLRANAGNFRPQRMCSRGRQRRVRRCANSCLAMRPNPLSFS